MIGGEHDPITMQAKVLKISRGTVYLPRPVSSADLAITPAHR